MSSSTSSESTSCSALQAMLPIDHSLISTVQGHRIYPRSPYPPESMASDHFDDRDSQELDRWPYPAQSPTEGLRRQLPPLRLSTTSAPYRVEKAFARAILSSMPQDARDSDWKNGVQGAAGFSWKLDRVLFPENELSVQLLRYNEMFGYLARVYHASMSHHSPERVDQVIRRGKQILAAVRLLSHQPQGQHPPASGTEARNPSQVSGLGWKPMREMALAEKVSERRLLRELGMKDAQRQKTRDVARAQACPVEVPVGETTNNEDLFERRGAVDLSAVNKCLAYPVITTDPGELGKTPEEHASNIHPSMAVRPPLENCRKDSIRWHIPSYDYDGRDIPIFKLPSPPHAESRSNSQRSKQRSNPRPPLGLTTPYYSYHSPSGNVSPKTTTAYKSNGPSSGEQVTDITPLEESASPNTTYPDAAYGPSSGEEKSTDVTSPMELISPLSHEPNNLVDFGDISSPHQVLSSESIGSNGNRLRKIKGVFKRVPIPKLRPMPLSSSTTSGASSSSNSEQKNSPSTPVETVGKAIGKLKTTFGSLGKRSGQLVKAELAVITLRNNTTTTSETVGLVDSASEEHSIHGELTRTEKEYQDLLDVLETTKRTLREERERNKNYQGRRSMSRGRKSERTRRAVRAGSREQVERWLGGTDE